MTTRPPGETSGESGHLTERAATAWWRFRHRLYRNRPGWRRSPWAGGGRYWYEPEDGWPEGPPSDRPAVTKRQSGPCGAAVWDGRYWCVLPLGHGSHHEAAPFGEQEPWSAP